MTWVNIHEALTKVASTRPDLSEPPVPLILAGWAYTNDAEKMNRWKDTLRWAKDAGCDDVIAALSDDDFYHSDKISTYPIGPFGGPMYRAWDFKSKERPAEEDINSALQKLIKNWSTLAAGFASTTRPLAFTGSKARRLVVSVASATLPPWGDWDRLSPMEETRRTFTRFRKAVNAILKPLEVDHIDFIKEVSIGKRKS